MAKKNNPQKQAPQAQTETTQQPASSRRRPVIALTVLVLVAMFLVSFIYRTQNQGMQVQRRPQQAAQGADHGDSQSGIPAAMEQAMMGEIGTMMEKLQENPDDVELLLQLSERFMTLESWDKAEVFLTRAMIAQPGNLDALYKLGIVNFELQRPKDAAGYFEQIIALDPSHGHAQLNLGILYKHYLDKPEQARERFEAVLQIEGMPEEMLDVAKKELGSGHENGASDAGAPDGS